MDEPIHDWQAKAEGGLDSSAIGAAKPQEAFRSTRCPSCAFGTPIDKLSGPPAVRGADCNSACGFTVPLGLIGGPLLPQDFGLFDLLERAGGRVVLDATEFGLRTLPRRSTPTPAAPTRWPNWPPRISTPSPTPFAGRARPFMIGSAARWPPPGPRAGAAALCWCDLWHAEWQRMKEWSPVPLLEIDVADDEESLPRLRPGGWRPFWK